MFHLFKIVGSISAALYSCPVYVTQLFIATRKKYETRKAGRGKGLKKRKAKREEKNSKQAIPTPLRPPPLPPPPRKKNWLMCVGKLKYFTFWYVILGKFIFLVKIAFSAKIRSNQRHDNQNNDFNS